ncbi:polysaccharide deacetylase family protein [Aureliella helgolandensis]|uniref:Glycoside hydrolase family 38 N-terminal domain-containing protein n=1 Tax=Aureliella helgolandensis TaxID=2527968 RepID=A0A518G9Y9_9BACT|nr:hypothetical protein [Aureliella helgolandensis]QDV25417.1 hypothetical protein Q31a_37430 [Aureliella helgolandensis]
MQVRECVLFLPSYELDGYPRHLPSPEAAALLSGWIGLWHPQLMALSQTLPRWHQVESPPSNLEHGIYVLPECSTEYLPHDLEARVADANSVLLRPVTAWRDMQQRVLKSVGLVDEYADEHPLAWIVPQFAALGFAYLQVQLMTRQLRYSSNLDLTAFSEQAMEAAEAAQAGNAELAEEKLQGCFDSLGQERDHYYSLDVHLVDVTLLAPTTLGRSLAKQLDNGFKTSYLASAELLSQLRDKNGTNFQQFVDSVASEQACVVGGLERERPTPLMARETMARDALAGRAAYAELGVEPPLVFGRMSYGLLPDSAAFLRRLGYKGTLLLAFSNGRYPLGNQTKISWEASDGTFLSALAGPVLDASDPASFHSIGWTLGDALDHQHVPTVLFAHWPGRYCEFYELLQLVAARTPALGKWQTASDYFIDTDQPYHQERLKADAFQCNWLAETEDAGELLLATKAYHLAQAQLRSVQNLSNLLWQLQHSSTRNDKLPVPTPEISPDPSALPLPLAMQAWAPDLAALQSRVDSLFDDIPRAEQRAAEIQQQLDQYANQVLQELAGLLAAIKQAAPTDNDDCVRVLLNPRSCPVRVISTLPTQRSYPADTAWHFAEASTGDARQACIDLPSMGFVASDLAAEPSSGPREAALAENGGLIRNEFLEAQVDMSRGHLRTLHVPGIRGNRFSLQLARRTHDAQGELVYSEMVASKVQVITANPICGVIRASGVLKEAGRSVGKFEVDYQTTRGSRILEVKFRLSELQPLGDGNPWRAAYVARLAWPTEAAILKTYACGGRQSWTSGKAIAPALIDIDEADYHTQILTGGLAFHRRTDLRFLETILATEGQSSVEHRMGIGVDLPYPIQSAMAFMDHPYEVSLPKGNKPISKSGWLVSCNAKNVTVELECPLVDEQQRLIGMRLFLTENAGKSTSAGIRLFRELKSAARVDYIGGKVGDLSVSGDRVTIALRSSEQVNVDVVWS